MIINIFINRNISIQEKEQLRLLKQLIKMVNNADNIDRIHNLRYACKAFASSATVNTIELDNSIKEKYNSFYNEEYVLITKTRTNEIIKIINKNIEIAINHNKTQGQNGGYSLYAQDPLQYINQIIEYKSINLNKDIFEKIVNIIKETLISEKQTVKAKINACKLLMYLKSKYDSYFEVLKLKKWLIKNREVITEGHEDLLFEKETQDLLYFCYLLLMFLFKGKVNKQITEFIYSINQEDSYILLSTLKLIDEFLNDLGEETISNELIEIIMHFSIMMLNHKEIDVRFYSIKCLITLSNYSKYQNLILSQLSKVMDNGTYQMKVAIVSRLKYINETDGDYKESILLKAKADNNYWVRKLADENT